MKPLLIRHKNYWTNKEFVFDVILALILLLASFFANFYAGIYATEKASNPVTDIILDNIPVYDVDMIFIYGPLFLWAIVTALCLREPKRIPFVIQSIALFVLVRSVFISLTHIGPFPDMISIDYASTAIKNFTFGGDLFFSAHTGLPYLMALLFWKNIRLRIFFIAMAIIFGIVVLMGHLHYSIDVLAAFFITYSIFIMAQNLFPKGWRFFHSGLSGDGL